MRPRTGGPYSTGAQAAQVTAGRRAFSLMELIVVMAVTLLLTGLMLPALAQVRENSHRVVCSSNLRQTGLALVMFADDWRELPDSVYGVQKGYKSEMMAAHRGESPGNWEGLGWLYEIDHGRYLPSPQVFYCPSHHGEHCYERYSELYDNPGSEPIYTNYHYAGPIDWKRGTKRRINAAESFVLVADGLRTVRDFNHRDGINVLRNDNSVNWRSDIADDLIQILSAAGPSADDGESAYSRIWDLIQQD